LGFESEIDNSKVAAVLGSILTSSDKVESEGQQCLIKFQYCEKNNPKIPLPPLFGTDPNRIGLLGKPSAVKQFLSYKSQ
jgi:hypothetical protein